MRGVVVVSTYNASQLPFAPKPSPSHPTPARLSEQRILYRLPFFSASFMTFLTIFCSSIRKARTTRSLTQLAQREPPYARWTVFLGLETWAYSRGRSAGICVQSRVSHLSQYPFCTHLRMVCYVAAPECPCRGRGSGGKYSTSSSGWTYAWQLGAAVTAFRRSALLLDVQVSQLTTGSLHNADLVALGVVWLPAALYPAC